MFYSSVISQSAQEQFISKLLDWVWLFWSRVYYLIHCSGGWKAWKKCNYLFFFQACTVPAASSRSPVSCGCRGSAVCPGKSAWVLSALEPYETLPRYSHTQTPPRSTRAGEKDKRESQISTCAIRKFYECTVCPKDNRAVTETGFDCFSSLYSGNRDKLKNRRNKMLCLDVQKVRSQRQEKHIYIRVFFVFIIHSQHMLYMFIFTLYTIFFFLQACHVFVAFAQHIPSVPDFSDTL